MRKELTTDKYIDMDDFSTVDDLIEKMEKFRDWCYVGVNRYGEIVLTQTRMETDDEMTARLRKEQATVERKRADAQKKLENARAKVEKAAAEYAALEERLKKEVLE